MNRSYRFGEFRLEVEERRLLRNGDELFLPPKVFDTLVLLVEKSGHLVSKDDFIRTLWPDTFVGDDTLAQNISLLRKALVNGEPTQEWIATVPRRGYRFVGSVESGDAVPPPSNAGFKAVSRGGEAPLIKSGPSRAKFAARILAFAAAVVLGGWWAWTTAAKYRSRVTVHSIAVLPLENLSGDAHQDYFADALTDELIKDLGQINSLRVISRTSIMKYKSSHKTLPQMAGELDVDAVVKGSVFRSGEHVKITAQLIEARSGRRLWSGSYERDLRDVLALQDEVATDLTDQIHVQLTPQERASLKTARQVNPGAFEAYVRALSQKGTVDGLQKKIAYFEQAVAQQPDYPEAHIGLGRAYLTLGHLIALAPQEAFPRAKAEALKALEADESLSDSHELLGSVRFLYDWDFPGAEKEFRRAIALNPNSIVARASYANFLSAIGRSDEAIAERVRNRQIDPLSLSAIGLLGFEQYWAGRYDPAMENARSVLVVDPNDYNAHLCLGLCLEQKGELATALVELQKAADLSNDKLWLAFVAHAKARAGDKTGAMKIVGQLEKLSQSTYVSPWSIAIVYPDLGDKEKAFYWLEKAYQGREHDLVFSRVWPMFDSLRSDPRWVDLMRRVGLPSPITGS